VIQLAHSNFLTRDSKQQERMKPYSPLSTLIAAALLRREGHEVALFDATFEQGLDAFEAKLDAVRPDALLLIEDNFNFLTKMCTTARRQSALAMIALAAERGCRIAVNGPDSADNPAVYLCAGADAIVLGEGEMAMLEVANHWREPAGELADIAGLILPTPGQAHATRPRRAQQDLDQLPHPAWDLVDVASYRAAWINAHGLLSWNIAASRGCPYACNWCAKPTFGRRYTVRSPEDVALEMLRLKQQIAPGHLWFTDDILGLDVDWICAFADEVERTGAAIPYTMQSRVNLMTEKSVEALARAGASEVWLGIESGSQAILDAMDKGTTVEAGRLATRLLKARGIKACWFIQLGYPSESWEDLLATRDLIRHERPDEIGVSVAYPLPGTLFYERVRVQLGRQRNWKDTGDLAMLFQGTFDTELYRRVRNILHDEVERGLVDDGAWDELEERVHLHRSPRPISLAVGS
jgi:anaerobic magnesium-protoporphyrin IX monomethyl ester cyclase